MARLTVLLVEDDDDTRDLLSQVLADEFELSSVPDGVSALALVEARPFDVVVTDEGIPGMRGTALAAEIKRRAPRTRVILVTGYSAPLGASACDAVLRKPFEVEALVSLVQQRYGGKESPEPLPAAW